MSAEFVIAVTAAVLFTARNAWILSMWPPPSPDPRLVSALSMLGRDHRPPAGWEDRVRAATLAKDCAADELEVR